MKKNIIIFSAALLLITACNVNPPSVTKGNNSIPETADMLLTAKPEQAIKNLINSGYKVTRLDDDNWVEVENVKEGDIDISDQWNSKQFQADYLNGAYSWSIQFGEPPTYIQNESNDARNARVQISMPKTEMSGDTDNYFEKSLELLDSWHKYILGHRIKEITAMSGDYTLRKEIAEGYNYEGSDFYWEKSVDPKIKEQKNIKEVYNEFFAALKNTKAEERDSWSISYQGQMSNGDPFLLGFGWVNVSAYNDVCMSYHIMNFIPLPIY